MPAQVISQPVPILQRSVTSAEARFEAWRQDLLSLGLGGRSDVKWAASEGVVAYAAKVTRLFAPVFEVTDEENIEKAALAVICFDYFCRSVDHLTDAPDPDISVVHQGSLALVHGLRVASDISSDHQRFMSHFEAYLREASEGERRLWQYKDAGREFSSADLQLLGKKNAVVKAAPALLAAISGRWDRLPLMEAAVEHLSVAVQLLDDVVDWEEDLCAGLSTFPIALAFQRCGARDRTSISAALFCGGVALEAITLARTAFSEAADILIAEGGTALLQPTLGVIRSLDDMRSILGGARPDSDPEDLMRQFRDRLHPVVAYSGS